jgi:hypothetical protein
MREETIKWGLKALTDLILSSRLSISSINTKTAREKAVG